MVFICRPWDSCLVPGPVIVTLPIGISCVLFLAFVRRIVVSSVVWSLSAVRFLFSPWSCHRYVTHRLLVCVGPVIVTLPIGSMFIT